MAYTGQTLRSPFLQTGLRDDRSQELLPVTSLVLPSKNLNFHENGLTKRGGNALYLTNPLTGTPRIQGGFQFRLSNGAYFHLFAANGKIYQSNESNVLKTGHSTSNPISFMQIGAQSGQTITQYVFWADGQIVPQYAGINNLPTYLNYTPSGYEWIVVLAGIGFTGLAFLQGERFFGKSFIEHGAH